MIKNKFPSLWHLHSHGEGDNKYIDTYVQSQLVINAERKIKQNKDVAILLGGFFLLFYLN